jgi:hypothetical protein
MSFCSTNRPKQMGWRCPDTHHNEIQHNDTQHNDIQYNNTKNIKCDEYGAKGCIFS